jgi:hypothetical protein
MAVMRHLATWSLTDFVFSTGRIWKGGILLIDICVCVPDGLVLLSKGFWLLWVVLYSAF